MESKFPVCSREQQEVIRLLKIDNKNCIVQGIPGAGKTTLIISIANAFPRIQILALTFSALLKNETRSKIAQFGLKNLQVHSYHSFAKTYYEQADSHTDVGLIEIIQQNLKPHSICPFTMILLDEDQDKTFTYHQWTLKIIHDHFIYPLSCRQQSKHRNEEEQEKETKDTNKWGIVNQIRFDQQLIVCVLGDPYQNIYAYKGSDVRYLTLASSVLKNVSTRQWANVELKTSFRLTKPMTEFINHHVFHKEQKLVSNKDGPPVEYYHCCAWNDSMDIIHSLLWKDNIRPEDIFIFSTSTGPKTLISKISNYLSSKGSFTFISNEDSPPNSSHLMKNKISFLTHWKGKGLERKVSVILHFDSSMLHWDPEQKECSPALFVALTRGSERLIVIHDHRYPALPFMDVKSIQPTIPSVSKSKFNSNSTSRSGTDSVGPTVNMNCKCPITFSLTDTSEFQNVSSAVLETNDDYTEVSFDDKSESIHPISHNTIPSRFNQEGEEKGKQRKIESKKRKREINSTGQEDSDGEEGIQKEEEIQEEKRIQKEDQTQIKPDFIYSIPQLLRHRQVLELMRISKHVQIKQVVVTKKSTGKNRINNINHETSTKTQIRMSDCSADYVDLMEMENHQPLYVPSIVFSSDNTIEDIRSLNEIVIPTLFQYSVSGKCDLLNNLFQCYKKSQLHATVAEDVRLQRLFHKIRIRNRSNPKDSQNHIILAVSDLLFLSCAWDAHVSGHHHKLIQFQTFDWIQQEDIATIQRMMEPYFQSKTNLLFSFPLSVCTYIPSFFPSSSPSSSLPPSSLSLPSSSSSSLSSSLNNTTQSWLVEITETLDIVDLENKTIYQFHYDSEITLENRVRMECVMWMMKNSSSSSCPFLKNVPWDTFEYKIINVFDGQVCTICIPDKQNTTGFDDIIYDLIHMKRSKRSTLTDEEFLQQCSLAFTE